jgi:hypothetical protein
MDDLKSRDWLLFSTKSLILSVDQNISIQIIDTPDGGKRLIANGITDNSIEKLYFIVNTDRNNNYLYLEEFNVYKKNSSKPLNIPGLDDIMKNAFRSSDALNFISDNKTHKPFAGSNFKTTSSDTFSQYIDELTGFLPNTLTTKGVEKTYEIILNPYDWMSDAADALNPNKNGFNQAMDPNKNGLSQSAENTANAIRRGLDMGNVRMGGSNRRASEAMPTMGGMRRLSGR